MHTLKRSAIVISDRSTFVWSVNMERPPSCLPPYFVHNSRVLCAGFCVLETPLLYGHLFISCTNFNSSIYTTLGDVDKHKYTHT